MNTSDRSIALLDIALRRRFEFEELMPQPELLRGITVINDSNTEKDTDNGCVDLEKLLTCINNRILEELDRDHTIGHAYFLSAVDSGQITLRDLNKIFLKKIIPLLQEYFYDDWSKIAKVLNDENTKYFIKIDKKTISQKLKNLQLGCDEFKNIYANCNDLVETSQELTQTEDEQTNG